MNFFEHQDRARQNTQQLIGLFSLSIAVMIMAIYIAALFLFRMAPRVWWHPGLFISVAGITIIAIAVGSLYKITCLRQGGSLIAQELGGSLLLPDMADEQGRQLLNIVEEMAIASGISVPQVYLLERETSINAFAAGFTPNDAVIGVTRGTLQHLSRDELQGVIGHEFSHILNGDMRLNLRLVGLLHGILFIYLTGELLWRIRGDFRLGKEDKGLPIWAFGLALMAIGGIGLLCGRLIKAAVSRQREFLADASAVQFTRNPNGLTGVFQKLQQMDSRLISPAAEAASHMFFGNALNPSFWENMFSTHPPLTERIRRVGGLNVSNLAAMPSRNQMRSPSQESLTMGFAGGSSATPEQFVNQVGSVTPEHFSHAQGLLSQLPESLRLGVREQHSAMALAFALALDSENIEIKQRQITWLREVQPPELVDKTLELSSEISQLDPKIRLPLVDLAVPILRQNSAKECQRLCKCVHGLVVATESLSLWHFVLQLILWHRLQPSINPTSTTTVEFTSIEQIWPDCLLVLSVIARVGHSQPDAYIEDIAYAFRSGVFRLPKAGEQEKPEIPLTCNFTELKKSIERLRLASPKLKQAIVDACAHTVLLDNKVTQSEADLLRAIAMTLDCPIPPFLNPQRSVSKQKKSS
ncbi:M48 family metallopeptidase [Nostoc sp. 'Peltigera membranacea cyanobiont' N6]|uniref:M48 family metallopeptidase n=1 Tax=Nostoc sp. 'Peltigera membranacea cyanobiont' N6 TaxID=1261031 RepID=UPI000CF34A61|nr:M48 family metallopeptidase [Nostoc sp. 'Peltigera membranacea cyanobiont' N6]AVH67090.1 peptidase M48 [Nostoc sp. 'Peltigera membranacea cyanobiont' N6]